MFFGTHNFDRQMARHLVADGAVRPILIAVLTPILQFIARIRKGQEPVGIQTFSPRLAVKRFNEAVIGWLAWAREVEGHDLA